MVIRRKEREREAAAKQAAAFDVAPSLGLYDGEDDEDAALFFAPATKTNMADADDEDDLVVAKASESATMEAAGPKKKRIRRTKAQIEVCRRIQ